MATGRTVPRFLKFQIEDGTGAMRDLAINGWGEIGLTYEEMDLSAWQDAIKAYFLNQASMDGITITGPMDNSAAVAASGTGVAPAISGSHGVLSVLNGASVPRSFGAYFGIQAYWSTGDPVFGGIDCVLVSSYTVSDGKFSAKICLAATRTNDPAWGTAAIAASS
jgi:hypothetical protein